jgi:hypothetical protein
MSMTVDKFLKIQARSAKKLGPGPARPVLNTKIQALARPGPAKPGPARKKARPGYNTESTPVDILFAHSQGEPDHRILCVLCCSIEKVFSQL